jgi:hypothetical protein
LAIFVKRLLLAILFSVLIVLRKMLLHSVKEKLLVRIALEHWLLLLLSWLALWKHVSIEVNLYAWVLSLERVEHVLHVTHDSLDVDELPAVHLATSCLLLILHPWHSIHKARELRWIWEPTSHELLLLLLKLLLLLSVRLSILSTLLLLV